MIAFSGNSYSASQIILIGDWGIPGFSVSWQLPRSSTQYEPTRQYQYLPSKAEVDQSGSN